MISFQSICQSPRKLWATSDHALARASAARARPVVAARRVVLVAGVGLLARARAPAASTRRGTNSRSSRHISPIITSPPRYSASVNCQPIRTHSTSPSSHTRFVEANWKASADAAEAPFWNRRLGDRDRGVGARRRRGAQPGRAARPARGRRRPARARSRSRGTHACTIAEIAKPSTSAHQTSQAISTAFDRPSPTLAMTSATRRSAPAHQAPDGGHQLVRAVDALLALGAA